jgi:hypothetical protein
MGIMAISNNLNPFIDDMIRAKATTGSWKGAVGQLTSGLMGVGGLSVAFSLIVAAIQAVSFMMAKGSSETNKMKTAVSELKSELEKASYQTLKQKEIESRLALIDAENKLLAEQNEEYKKITAQRQNVVTLDKTTLGSSDTKAEVDKAKEQLNLVIEYQDKLGLVSQQENRIAELREKRRGLRSETEIAAIDKEIAALEKLYKTKADKKQKDFFTTDAEIRLEIQKMNTLLAGNLTAAERIRLLEMRATKVKELIVVNDELIKQYEKTTRIDNESFAKDTKKDLKGPFNILPIENIPKPEAFKETNDELVRMLELSDAITTSFNRAATAVASAAAAGISVFKQENSLLQIFINNLIRAAAEALTLKLITTGLNIIGGLFGVPFFGSAVTGAVGAAGGATSSLSNPGLSGVGASSSASLNRNSGSSVIIQTVPVVMDTKMKGRDVYFTQRKHESYRRKYYGSSAD